MLSELMGCDHDYIINDVVPNLEKVLAGELPEYEFGCDATIIDFRKDRPIINHDFFEEETEIDSKEIFQLLNEWKEYLLTWKNL